MHRMACLLALVLVPAAVSLARSVDTVILRATLTTGNEVPRPSGEEGSGTATVYLHLTRDDSGEVTFGVADFEISYDVLNATNFVALNLHLGAPGATGDAVIPTDVSSSTPVVHPGGTGRIFRQAVVLGRVPLLNRILAQPDQFYVNLATAANPAGLIRGQLARADLLVLRAHMSPLLEVPAITDLDASGSGSFVILAVRDSSGQIVSGVVTFDVNYRFAPDGTFTGLHFHNGRAGVVAGIVLPTNLSSRENIAASESGNVTRPVEVTGGAPLTALRQVFVDPQSHYVNMHTTVHPGGAIRGQLQFTGTVILRTDLSPANEVPPVTGLQASAAATVSAYVTRNESGQVTSGTLVFDVTHEFPGRAQLIGLRIHRGAAGTSGPVVIDSGISSAAPVVSPTGVGNVMRFVSIDANNPTALAALNDLVASPDRFYLNLYTSANPDGAVRGQLGVAAAGPPQINAGGLISAVGDAAIAAASPGAIISIFGRNLAQITSDASGQDVAALPISLNGSDVRIGGRQAPLYFVSPTQINAQVPYEIEPGNVQVFVGRPGDVLSASFPLLVTPFSPGIFVTSLGAAVLKNADFSLVSSSNPAAAGEVLSIFGTGLGAVTPQVRSGQFAPSGPIALTRSQPSVTIGGRDAEVLASALAPGFVGLYQVAVRMPSGVASGNQPVVITIGGIRSNAAPMAVR